MFLAGCADGNLLRLRRDVDAEAAREIEALAAIEPPFAGAEAEPVHLQRYCRRLQARPNFGLTFELPHGLTPGLSLAFVHSGTAPGQALTAELDADGMPPHLVAAGFGALEELWPPWTIARKAGEIAAIAFAARLGPRGAALGLHTFEGFRGRGVGAAVTAAWTQHPDLQSRTLFYGCARENRSSRRVVERLGLRLIGPTLRLA